MTTLSNAQHRILEDAANLPDSEIEKFVVHLPAGARGAVITALLKKGCIGKRGGKHYINAAGFEAIGREMPKAKKARDKKPATAKSQRSTKGDAILSMLRKGATVEKLMEATGWQSHSVRGFISNLRRKQNLTIVKSESANGQVYRLAEDQAA